VVTKAGLTVPLHNFKITIQNQRFEKKKKKEKQTVYFLQTKCSIEASYAMYTGKTKSNIH
jgi:hypothetical protein